MSEEPSNGGDDVILRREKTLLQGRAERYMNVWSTHAKDWSLQQIERIFCDHRGDFTSNVADTVRILDDHKPSGLGN